MGTLVAGCGVDDAAPAAPAAAAAPPETAVAPTALSTGAAPLLQVGMLLYPGFTAQDYVGPQLAFAGMGDVKIHTLWKDLAPVACDTGFGIVPDTLLSDCPADLDILFVPGGSGTFLVMNDLEIIEFLQDRASRARYVTSVCTGSLLLAAAGLLRGYRAASHWAYRHLLPIMGATPTRRRVFEDRDRITGAGITSGLDFGLTVSARIRGRHRAKMQQLAIQYDPEPPFDTGTPEDAGPQLTAEVRQLYVPNVAAHETAAIEARNRLGL